MIDVRKGDLSPFTFYPPAARQETNEMFRIQSQIFRKGLILLCVPLLFEVIVATTLVFLQHYYGDTVKAEALRNEIIYHINHLWNDTLVLTTKRFGKAFFKGFATDALTGNRIAERGALLKELLADDPEQLERLQEVMDCSNHIRNLSLKLKANLARSLGPLNWLRRNLNTCRRLTEANIEVG